MRIAFYSDNFYPEISGISDSLIILGTELVRQGHSVAFICPKYAEKDYAKMINRDTDMSRLSSFSIHRIPSLPISSSASGQMRMGIPLGHSLSFIKRFKPDVIHTQTPGGVGFEALLVSRLTHTPLVGTNHTPVEEFMAYYPFHGKIATKMVYRLYSWYYNRCLMTTTPCNNLIDDMRKHHFVKPAQATPNPLPSALFTPPSEKEKFDLKRSFSFAGPVIIYSGRIAPEKHIDTIIRALPMLVKKIPDITLIVTGHGIVEKELKKLADDLGVSHNIFWSGFVDMPTLAKLYKTADIFMIMSTAETQSLALMQAYATGIPGIGADNHGLKEYIPSRCGFRISHNDDKALACLVLELLTDDNKRISMGNAAEEFSRQFQPKIIADRWIDIYKKAIDTYHSQI